MSLRTGFALAVISLTACVNSASGAITLTNGQSVTLNQILDSNDRAFIVGDKKFTIVSYTSPTFIAANTSVVGFIANDPLTGIGFDLFGGFGDAPGDSLISEFNIRYTVEIIEPFLSQGFRIVDSELTFNGNATGTGSYARVDESVLDFFAQPGQNLIGTKRAFDIAGPPRSTDLQDRLVFSPRVKLEVIKDVQFFAFGQGSTATASSIRQSFSQIPAPGAMALLAVGGLIATRRKR